MVNFNREIFLSNIRYLAKSKNIKIGDIESNAGVSIGYLSRLDKEDSKTIPGTDFATSVSNTLGVSIEALVSEDFSKLTETESYLLGFLKKLLEKTTLNDVHWLENTEKEFNEIDPANSELSHPLFRVNYDPDCLELWSTYDSVFHKAINFSPKGSSFYVNISDTDILYLMSVRHAATDSDGTPYSAVDEIELYASHNEPNNQSIAPVCSCLSSDLTNKTIFFDELHTLYKAANENCKHVQINNDAKSIIDSFME